MIVEITSWTPRVTLSTAAISAQAAPVSIATSTINGTCTTAGTEIQAPNAAATSAAIRYWPSTPMLKRFILKPIATASPAM
jgi:hypothetical protein